MTPLYLSPPPSSFQLGEQKDDQHLQLFLSSSHPPFSSLSCPTFFNTTRDQRLIKIEDDQKVGQYIAHGGSSSNLHVVSSYSSLQPMMDEVANGYNMSLCKREVAEGSTSTDNGSSKWMSSKMRLMQKMINSNCTESDESVKIMQKFQYQMHETNEISCFNNSKTTIRVCADCNTTTTPLWRSGPRGPKSLCNACGIRQRKARRAMEAAANGTIGATETKIKVQNKEKKSRTSHVPHYKKQYNKSPDPLHHQIETQRKLCFKDFALSLSKNSALKQVFSQDVEEAAILLMELSCGFIQS